MISIGRRGSGVGPGLGGHYFQLRQPSRNLCLAAGLGYWCYPALIYQNGRVLWLHLVFGIERRDQGGFDLYRPKAMAITEPSSPMLVHYEDFRRGDDPFGGQSWSEPIGKHPHPAIQKWTPADLEKKEGLLLSLYRHAEAPFTLDRSLPDDFRALFVQLTNPLVMACLRPLSTEFCRGLQT